MVKKNELKVEKDVVVTMDYRLEVEGQEVDSGPITFLQGHGNIISGLEKEIEGMDLGDEKEIMVKAEEAYGHYDPEMEIELPLKTFPPDFKIELGRPMRLHDDEGHVFTGVAVAITNEVVKMNMNHPLAGKDLLFKTKVLDLRQATELEITQGHLASGCSSCSSGNCSDC